MHSIQASTCKATCLQLMDNVAKTGEKIIITKNGKPISPLCQASSFFQKDLGKNDSLLIIEAEDPVILII